MEIHHKGIQNDVLSLDNNMVLIHLKNDFILKFKSVVHFDLDLHKLQSIHYFLFSLYRLFICRNEGSIFRRRLHSYILKW